MKLYSENENYKLYNGNMLDMLDVIKPNSIDSIVTDPPYGLTSITKRFGKENSAPAQYGKDGAFGRLSKGFMGKEWDGSGIEYNIETWEKCYEVLKPGGYLLAFGGSRTYHRIACAIEDAGFEIRDTICWIYGSGFPKSMNIGKGIDAKLKYGKAGTSYKREIEQSCEGETHIIKQTNNGAMGEIIETTRKDYKPFTDEANEWNGWGTCLKPSFEPIIVARKPFKGSLVDNVLTYGVGGLNIDECRIGTNKSDLDKLNREWDREWNSSYNDYANNVGGKAGFDYSKSRTENKKLTGRFPANTILTYDESDYEEVCGGFPNTKSTKSKNDNRINKHKSMFIDGVHNESNSYNDSGSASRYFYCAKASKRDRDEGLEQFEAKQKYYCDGRANSLEIFGSTDGGRKPLKNIHPTVKPTSLMSYLVRLVTPNGGTILDPFNGSGSTGKAVMYENKDHNKNYKYIGIELTEEYLPIAKARIEYVCNLEEEQADSQMTIFDYLDDNKLK